MDPVEQLDVVVIGGGVIGLAVSRAFALRGREVALVEAETSLGVHTSSRNSEVIHAGIYYPAGSLKAALCVQGKRALYDYCEARGIAHRRTGKIIVASREEEVPVLEKLVVQARANGVDDLERLDEHELRRREPAVIGVGALFSPSTGIVDSHGLMSALRADAEASGANVVTATPVLGGVVNDHSIDLQLGGVDPVRIRANAVINAAGLFASELARRISGIPRESIPETYYAIGHYFGLAGRSPFQQLVYPVPVPGGLGVHVTLDLAGQARFGPDVAWLDRIDYRFDESRAASFYDAIRQYYPGLRDGALVPGYTGIRPKLGPAGSPAQDFLIQGPRDHGVPGLVQLFGIESPGLTAALAIADRVVGMVES